AQAHMEMKKPLARRSKFNPYLTIDQIDYSLSSPLGTSYPYPCRGAPKGSSVATYNAGDKIQVELFGEATHNGGHCQFAVSYDEGKTFVVLRTIMKTCMLEGLSFDVPIPEGAPSSSNVVFAWTWINRSGNREYYMNCADITIVGKKNNGSIVGPKLLVANLPNSPSIPEFFSNQY
ncbi:putative endoglucanase precursor, partial [Basidiobolus meristosporus CBS 931.73]